MKLIATTLMMTILCLMPIQAQDRDNIDGNLRVKYLYFFKEDSTMQGFYADSSMCLDVTGNETVFYSERFYLQDSAVNAAPLPITVAVNLPAEFRGYCDYGRYFIDFKNNEYVKYDNAAISRLKGHGTLEMPQWELTDRYDTICGYPCRMATAKYLGRTWGVMYTTSIPASAGPWLLWGAPGLILYAQDSEFLFVFRAFDVGQLPFDRSENIRLLAENAYKLRSYKSIRKMEETLTRVKRSSAEDERLNGYEPSRIILKDGSTYQPQHKYIPLIPENYWEKKGRKH